MKIPGYTIQRELGHGGMSTVYLALQESLQRPVALKIMSPVLSNEPSYVERFMQEGRIVANLAHPYIVTIYDIGVIDSQPYMAMEYIEGGTLQQRIERGMRLEELFPVLLNVTHALAYAHARGIIHRDVKPGNIMFHADGKALLGDFGIAKAAGGDAGAANLRTGAITLGTPYYMSPEQVLRRPIDARADQYSLGVVLHECLTGRVPFSATDPFSVSLKHLTDPIPRLGGEAAAFQLILDRLMAKEPHDRYPDDQALLADLNRLAVDYRNRPDTGNAPVPVPLAILPGSTDTPADARTQALTTPLFPHPSGRRRLPRPLWLIGFLLTAAVGAAVYQWQGASDASSSPADEAVLSAAGLEPATEPTGSRPPAGVPLLMSRLEDGSLITLNPALAATVRTPRSTGDGPEIRELLEQAERHLANDRLTLPAGDNAYAAYQRILELEPGHPRALAGLEAIADRYVELVEAARRGGRISSARQLADRGLMVQPGHDRLTGLRRQLQNLPRRAGDPCERDRSSRACWCQTFGMFCS